MNDLEKRITLARGLLENVTQLAGVGAGLLQRIEDSEGRQALVRDLGQGVLNTLLSPAQPMAGLLAESTALGQAEEPEGFLESATMAGQANPVGPSAFEEVAGLAIGLHSALGAQTPLIGAQMVAQAVLDHARIAEEEATKRAEIAAARDVTVERIDATRKVISQYLQRTFDERRGNFDRLFDVLDRAQAGDDLEGMQLALTGILELVKSSPFKDISSFKKSFHDPDQVWEL